MQKTILSTADVARLFNVTETTVKRWADDGTLKCHKTPGGHRKFDISHVVEFANANSLDPTGTLSLDQDAFGQAIQLAVLNRDFSSLSRIFVEKALSIDEHDLFAFLSYLYQHRLQLWEIYDNVLRPGMTEIGNRWLSGDIEVYQEHRASHETLDAMAKLQSEIHRKPPLGMSAVCACLEKEHHEIGLRCAANILESEGWAIHYLGSETPYQSLLRSVKDIRPAVLCLSIVYAPVFSAEAARLKELRRQVHRHGGKVLVGGQHLAQSAVEAGYADVVLSSMKDLADFTYGRH